MKKVFILVFIIGVANTSIAQNVLGIATGTLAFKNTSSPQLTTQTNDILLQSNWADNYRLFIGVYFEASILRKLRVKQELAIYPTSHSYELLIPDNDPNSNFVYFNPVTDISFTTLNYRALVQIIKKRNLTLKAGPSLDFDFVRVPYEDPPYYAPNYPEAIELEKSLEDGFNPVTVYGDVEANYNWKRIDIAVNYKYSLTSQTGKFVYDGNEHQLRSVSTQLFLRIGYRFLVKDRTDKK